MAGDYDKLFAKSASMFNVGAIAGTAGTMLGGLKGLVASDPDKNPNIAANTIGGGIGGAVGGVAPFAALRTMYKSNPAMLNKLLPGNKLGWAGVGLSAAGTLIGSLLGSSTANTLTGGNKPGPNPYKLSSYYTRMG